MKTFTPNPKTIEREWYYVDAEDLVLGRLATRVATVLRGKHKPIFTPHLDTGDFVVVINAEKIRVTGRKEEQKTYWRHTGFPGGIISKNLKTRREKEPEMVIQSAVKGMLPKGPLGRKLLKKLKIYSGTKHPHHAQKPRALKI